MRSGTGPSLLLVAELLIEVTRLKESTEVGRESSGHKKALRDFSISALQNPLVIVNFRNKIRNKPLYTAIIVQEGFHPLPQKYLLLFPPAVRLIWNWLAW